MLLLGGLVLLSAHAAYGDISVSASLQPHRAQVGESLSLSITVSGTQNAPAPAFGETDGFQVRYIGPSTQISIVNGRMHASIEHRYSLLALQPGSYTIGPFTVEIDGNRYETRSFRVEISSAAAPSGSQAGAVAQQAGGTGQALRLVLAVPETDVYVHQWLPVDVTLYVGPIRVADVQYPTLEGETLSIDAFAQPTQRQEVIDGATYQVVRFQTSVVPLRAGTLVLGPASLRLSVVERRRGGGPFDDPFFDSFMGSRRPLDVRAEPLTLTVLPLPDEGKPADFSGAVGTFTMQVSAGPTELRAGDPVTVRAEVRGVGNLGDARPPMPTIAEGFRAYDAQVTASENRGAETVRSFEQVLIVHDDRVREVPPLRFSYFDPKLGRYESLVSQPIALAVQPALHEGGVEIVAAGERTLALPDPVGRDIVYIKDDPGRLSAHRGLRGKALLFLWQPVPLLLFMGALYYERRRERLRGDTRYARFTRAGKAARRGLESAERALGAGDREAFYDVLSRTMQDYLAAKLDLPPGAIDAEAVSGRSLSNDCERRIREFFATCEHVRFAPGSGDGDMQGTLSLARDIIKQLERERWGSSATVAGVFIAGVLTVAATAALGDAATPQTAFFRANALYAEGKYEEAIGEYEQVLHSGLESGALYYNLGNSYFKAGDRGRAVLNYERARRLLPRDPDVHANLAYARSQSGATACSASLWRRLLFPLAQRLTTSQLAWAASAVYTFSFLGLAAYRLWRRRPHWLLYASVGGALLLLAIGGSLAARIVDERQAAAVVTQAGENPVRFEPAADGTVHFVVRDGSIVYVLENRQDWLQVARCDGRRGWIPRSAVEPLW